MRVHFFLAQNTGTTGPSLFFPMMEQLPVAHTQCGEASVHTCRADYLRSALLALPGAQYHHKEEGYSMGSTRKLKRAALVRVRVYVCV